MIHYDEGAWVTPGLRGISSSESDSVVASFDQSTSPGLVDGSVHTVLADSARDRLLVGSRYGISVIDPFEGTASLYELPSGMEMYTMIRWSPGDSDFLVMGSNLGLHSITLENGLPLMGSMSESSIGPVEGIYALDTGSGDLDLMLFGNDSAWTAIVSNLGSGADATVSEPVPNEAMTETLASFEAEVLSALHVPMFGRGPLLLVGTDAGLIAWNTTDGSTSVGDPWWVFDRENAEDFVQRADLLMYQNRQWSTPWSQPVHSMLRVVSRRSQEYGWGPLEVCTCSISNYWCRCPAPPSTPTGCTISRGGPRVPTTSTQYCRWMGRS